MANPQERPSSLDLDVLIVGAGFAGLYALHRLREMGYTVRCCDRAEGVGGTWFWNRYPGARCDVESMDYSYSFSPELEQEWQWTERYPAQPEILRYLNHVADRFALRPDIRLGTRVAAAVLDESQQIWRVRLEQGTRAETVRTRFLVMASGCLSAARLPDIPGLGSFTGTTYHTADWPHEGVDFTGRRVGVIGTGSSGTQAIPLIARQAAHTTVFQRTANFSLPARNRPLDPDAVRELKARYREHRQFVRYTPNGTARRNNDVSALTVPPRERTAEYEARWQEGGGGFIGAFNDLLKDEAANDTAAEFLRGKIREIVHDPAVADALTPRGFPVGSKRVTVDTDYYATFNRPDVTLVDVRADPVQRITAPGIRTGSADHHLDSIVFATGFDAITGAVLAVDIRGRDGLALREKWAAGPRAYLGLATAGFPNLFLITGPGSPSVISNMVVSIEQHVEWISDHLGWLDKNGLWSTEADRRAEDDWVRHVAEVADTTLFPRGASWYVGANVPGKPRVFMPYVGGVGTYRRVCEDIAAGDYPGFVTRPL
ncbi:flavin-containing monooxygenase [Streptomyces spongiae]|uniref:NAD(P)/FAD-dependent oxidoreductase n=1 Tax=Streptomyces spongiae TaxID=565072 RepID=A0A5N8XBJ2_9ACTN|nr:NAD(P)/FAD-dependent oxidoreductase [Streptomyces spongiae]MPY56506.1 NAD(P)/FAD-dependent oxidoreductase [Streptomyces spongiae]